jgi:4-aminobutyrate aminotransferase-like enzyme
MVKHGTDVPVSGCPAAPISGDTRSIRPGQSPSGSTPGEICEHLLELKAVCQPISDRMCVLKIKPPMVITEEGCEHFVRALDDVLTYGW